MAMNVYDEGCFIPESDNNFLEHQEVASIIDFFVPKELSCNYRNSSSCDHVRDATRMAIFSKGSHRVASAIGFQAGISMGFLLHSTRRENEGIISSTQNSAASGDRTELPETLQQSQPCSVDSMPHTLFIRRSAFNDVPPRIDGLPEPEAHFANGIKFIYVQNSDEFVNLMLALQSAPDYYHLIVVDNCTQSLFSLWDAYRMVAITSLLSTVWSMMDERIQKANYLDPSIPRRCFGLLLLPPFQKSTETHAPLNLVSHLFDQVLNLDQLHSTDVHSSTHLLHDAEHYDESSSLEMTLNYEENVIYTKIVPK